MEAKKTFVSKTPEEISLIINLLKKLSYSNLQDVKVGLQNSEVDLLEEVWRSSIISDLTIYNQNDDSSTWKHLCSLLYIVSCLDRAFIENKELECLNIQQTQDLKHTVGVVIEAGVLDNLSPVLLKKTTHKSRTLSEDLHYYNRLVGTVYGIYMCFKSPYLKSLLVTNYLKPVLLAFYQIIFCPLKKPNPEITDTQSSPMTLQIYDMLIKHREMFRHVFKTFVSTIHPLIYIRETMLLLDKSLPTWLKKSLSNTLSTIIRNKNGVQNIVWAMLDSVGLDELDDTTKSWKILLPIAKIIIDTHKLPDFKNNICKQLCGILKLRTKLGESYKPFERLFALCTKLLYQKHPSLCEEVFLSNILEPLNSFTNNRESFVGANIEQSILLCYYLTWDDNFDIPAIPIKTIQSVLMVMFYVYLTPDLKHEIKDDVKNIFLKYLNALDLDEKYEVFDLFLFGKPHTSISEVTKELEFGIENNRVSVKRHKHSVRISCMNRADALSEIIKDSINIRKVLYTYLINSLCNPNKNCAIQTSTSLLELENTLVLTESSEHHLVIHKLLTDLSLDANIQIEVTKNPTLVIGYISIVLQRSVTKNVHKNGDSDSDSFQTLFLLVMLLQIFTVNCSSEDKVNFSNVIDYLNIMNDESTNSELCELCKQVLVNLQSNETAFKSATKSELDFALDDICDPLLPVRGHALMTLSKLVKKRDCSTMERKQYILNIFMQNLKNDDSFIYLSAIGGLAAMGDVFPDTILNVLADEYIDFSRKGSEDGHEVRMKLGEVLVRVTKILGEMASKYKTLLLNTFLEVTKDDDHLLRASSLSNLAEVCKVLGYKLGAIVTEVLVCVHSIITTDKAPEPRRAAVTVLRQLFVGLEKEMIVFLKDDILPIYRTLKHIYYHDKDDIMRLQAQLALEQLNENMKDFIFPNPQLHAEKRIIMLN